MHTPATRPEGFAPLSLLVGGMVVGVVFLWPAELHPQAVWGHPLGEADNHLWMYWRGVEGLFGGAEHLVNAPEGFGLALMDPVGMPAFLAGAWISAAMGWKVLAAWNVGLALFGGWFLGKEMAGPVGAPVAMVALGTAPFLAGVMDFGITESWPLGWFALHVACLLRHARGGGPGWAVGAGLALGCVALSGWYHATFGLVLEACLVPWLLWRHRRWGLLWQGLIGLGMALPAWVRFQGQVGAWEHRWLPPSPGPPGPRPDWQSLPVYGTDLLNLVLPSTGVDDPSKAVYIGAITLGLVGLALVRRRPGAVAMVLAALPLLALALGYWPTLAGKALGFPGLPWLLLAIEPDFAGLSHWHRAVGPAMVLLAGVAAVGAASLPQARRWVPFICGLILLDSLALSRTVWPRAAFLPVLPDSLAGLQGEGGVIQLAFDNGRAPFSDDPARLYNRWQVLHGRPVAENYEGVDAVLARSRLIGAAQAGCWVRSTLPPYYQVPPEMRDPVPPDGEALAQEVQQLRDWGYRWVVVHQSRCPGMAKTLGILGPRLGPATQTPSGDRVYDLDDFDTK